ncbi:MAG: GPI anchored serine-threonine rich family protein [bacterium]|nr:GPI anchored serine-threonine rich family protein [bacterium]
MKTVIFFLSIIFFSLLAVVGCRDIFGDRTEPESIVQPPQEGSNLVVTEPVHGKIWNPGDTIQIKWIAPTIKKIDLELYRKSEYKFLIAGEVSNYGNYSWIIPIDLPLSNHYLIKVSNHNNADVYKFSGRFGVQ